MPKKYMWNLGEVEAEQLTSDNVAEVAYWCNGHTVEEIDALDDSKTFAALNVFTLNGPKRAQEGDYIVKFPAGNFLVVPSHKFLAKYTLRYDD